MNGYRGQVGSSMAQARAYRHISTMQGTSSTWTILKILLVFDRFCMYMRAQGS